MSSLLSPEFLKSEVRHHGGSWLLHLISLTPFSVYTGTTANVFTQCYCALMTHWNKAVVKQSVSDINRQELSAEGPLHFPHA